MFTTMSQENNTIFIIYSIYLHVYNIFLICFTFFVICLAMWFSMSCSNNLSFALDNMFMSSIMMSYLITLKTVIIVMLNFMCYFSGEQIALLQTL